VLLMARPGKSTESLPCTPGLTRFEPVLRAPKSAEPSIQQTEEPETIAAKAGEPEPKVKDYANLSASTLLVAPSPITKRRSVTAPPLNTAVDATEPKTSGPPPASPTRRVAEKSTPPTGTRRPRRESVSSVSIFSATGAESIFRLLPRETRPAIRRMMFIEPSARCTISDLLSGTGKKGGLMCGCGGKECGGGLNTPPGEKDEEEDPECETDDGDAWLKAIVPCSQPGGSVGHTHIKVAVDEKASKKRFHF